MIVNWAPEALDDLAALREFIEQDDPAAARRVAQHILSTVDQLLSKHPEIGRPGRVPGTRELVISRSPFIVPYRFQGQTVQVLRVYHASRRWPENF